MTATTSDRDTLEQGTGYLHLEVKGATKIPSGTLVCLDADGWAVPAADTADYTFAGVAAECADNTDGSDGDIYVKVWRSKSFCLAYDGGSATRANIGDTVYIKDNQTVAVAGSVTQDIEAGKIVAIESTSAIYVDIEKAL